MFKKETEKDAKRLVAKIVMLGDFAVGKTALVQRFVKQSFGGQYKATMGLDLSIKPMKFIEGTVNVQLWDMAGQESFKLVRPRYYAGTRGAIMVYDITRPKTLQDLKDWHKELRDNIPNPVPYIVLGNKTDLIDLETVPKTEEFAIIQELDGIMDFRTSAKTGDNVEYAFRWLIRTILNESLKKKKKKEKKHKPVIFRGFRAD